MTENMIVKGGRKLNGHVRVDGAKNAVLPLLAATLLADQGKSRITNASLLSDVYVMNDVLRNLNAQVDFDEENNEIIVDASGDLTTEAPFELVSKMRASIVVWGHYCLVMVMLNLLCQVVALLVRVQLTYMSKDLKL